MARQIDIKSRKWVTMGIVHFGIEQELKIQASTQNSE